MLAIITYFLLFSIDIFLCLSSLKLHINFTKVITAFLFFVGFTYHEEALLLTLIKNSFVSRKVRERKNAAIEVLRGEMGYGVHLKREQIKRKLNTE